MKKIAAATAALLLTAALSPPTPRWKTPISSTRDRC